MVTATSPRPAAPLPAPHRRQLAGTRPHRTWPRAAALLLTYPFRTSPFATQPFARSGRRQQQPPGPGRMVPAAPGERKALQAAAEETVDPGPVPHPTHLPETGNGCTLPPIPGPAVTRGRCPLPPRPRLAGSRAAHAETVRGRDGGSGASGPPTNPEEQEAGPAPRPGQSPARVKGLAGVGGLLRALVNLAPGGRSKSGRRKGLAARWSTLRRKRGPGTGYSSG